jgi:hypothetical protein
MTRNFKTIILLLVVAAPCAATLQQDQQPSQIPQWKHARSDDPLHGKVIDTLTLEGKYLTPPRTPSGSTVPSLVVECSGGKVQKTYIVVGAVVSLQERGLLAGTLEERIDGKPGHLFTISISTDGTAVFFMTDDFKKILRAHRAIFGAQEYLGPEVVFEFDMPDPSPVYAGCGNERSLRPK